MNAFFLIRYLSLIITRGGILLSCVGKTPALKRMPLVMMLKGSKELSLDGIVKGERRAYVQMISITERQ